MRPAERALIWVAVALAVASMVSDRLLSRQVADLRRDLAAQRRLVDSNTKALENMQRELEVIGTEVELYFVEETPTALQLKPERRRIISTDLPAGVINELIKGPARGSSLRPILPRDTVVNGVKVRDAIAYADLGGGITRLNLGSEGEAALVGSIVKSLTGLPGIKQVQIQVNGAKVESLAGHVDVSVPLAPNMF